MLGLGLGYIIWMYEIVVLACHYGVGSDVTAEVMTPEVTSQSL